MLIVFECTDMSEDKDKKRREIDVQKRKRKTKWGEGSRYIVGTEVGPKL